SLVPQAFQERPGVRLAYLNTVIANVFGKQSIQAVTDALNNQLNCMLLEGVLPEHPRPVRHLLSAKRRLGIDPDQWITQYAICPECWKHLTPNQLKELLSPKCTVPDCPGVLYNERTDVKGKCIRITRKIMPHVSLIGSLRRMFMRPGFAKSIRDSRQDQPRRNDDDDYVMTDIHDGTLWHELETNTVHEIGELGTVHDRPQDLDNGPTATKLTKHRYGLHLTLNIDWMGILENRPHSSGPIYYAINDLPRDQRFLQVNVICAAIMPGPKEPNIQQINHCLEPLTLCSHDITHCVLTCIVLLYSGVKMDVYGEEEAADVFADNEVLACDMPASHKCNGTAGHSHDFHPCAFCDADVVKINTPDGYNNSKQTLALFFILDQLGENQSLKKADEWRRILTITPVILWWSWRDANDEIPNSEPPLPPNTVAPDFSRNLRLLYQAILHLCMGVRILASRSISMAQAHTGQSFLAHYCLECLQLRIPLTINHQASMHTADMIKKCGLVYGWWLFAFERFNGMLERVQHNGHDGGRIELTLLRNWVQTHLIYEYLLALPADTHSFELDQINRIIKVQAQDRGSMMMQIAVYQSEAAEDNVRLPLRTAKLINLCTYSSPQGVFYPILLQYFRSLWPDLNLVGDLSCDNGTPFYANKVARALMYIRKDGICYGCTMNRRTHSDSFAFISQGRTRVPVQIMALFVVGVLDVVPHVCAVVRRLVSDDNIPAMPWDLNASTLGIHVSYAELGPQEVIPVSRIECPLALIPVYSNIIKKDLWITISFDHVSVQITLV
ncbi:hypothetical protein BDR05DRAFT_898020, partial [Suillus weaverae]